MVAIIKGISFHLNWGKIYMNFVLMGKRIYIHTSPKHMFPHDMKRMKTYVAISSVYLRADPYKIQTLPMVR